MAVNLVTQAILAAQLEENIDRKAKMSRLANRKYEEMFKGKATTQVVIRRFPNVEHQHGVATNAGSNIVEVDATVQSETYDLTELEQLNIKVKDANNMINDFDQEDSLVNRAALRTALNHDAFVASLAIKNANTVLNNQSPATLTKDTVEAEFTNLAKSIMAGDVEEKNQAIFFNPAILALSNQSPAYTGFDKSLKFKETFNAGQVSGFAGAWTNNIPIKYTLTFTTFATADDTISIRVPNAKKLSEGTSPAYDEVVFTAKAAPSAAGEFDIAGSAAAQQTIITDMINGTGTPGSSSYIALSTADRNILRRGFVFAEDFGDINANKAGVTARAGTTIVASLTTNTLSTQSTFIIALDPLAIHFGELMKNFKIVSSSVNNQSFADNVMWENTYGGKVTTENKARIAIAEVTN